MSLCKVLYLYYLLIVIIALPSPAFANVGIPMIVFTLPGMIALLIPVVLLESFLAYQKLNLDYWTAVRVFGRANLRSTFLGIPLAWSIRLLLYVLFGVGLSLFLPNISSFGLLYDMPIFKVIFAVVMMIMSAPWLPGMANFSPVMALLATLISLVPAYWISWKIEASTVSSLVANRGDGEVSAVVRSANLASYSLLAFIVVVSIAINLLA